VVACAVEENLSLPVKSAEGCAVNDPGAVALETNLASPRVKSPVMHVALAAVIPLMAAAPRQEFG
jgi:hypothetical protein